MSRDEEKPCAFEPVAGIYVNIATDFGIRVDELITYILWKVADELSPVIAEVLTEYFGIDEDQALDAILATKLQVQELRHELTKARETSNLL